MTAATTCARCAHCKKLCPSDWMMTADESYGVTGEICIPCDSKLVDQQLDVFLAMPLPREVAL